MYGYTNQPFRGFSYTNPLNALFNEFTEIQIADVVKEGIEDTKIIDSMIKEKYTKLKEKSAAAPTGSGRIPRFQF
jgi:hypothetical protein